MYANAMSWQPLKGLKTGSHLMKAQFLIALHKIVASLVRLLRRGYCLQCSSPGAARTSSRFTTQPSTGASTAE